MTEQYFDRVYQVSSEPAEQQALYDEWAATYDDELERQGTHAPARLAEAVTRIVSDRTTPVLDFGCGTGLAGVALASEGWTTIDGADLSAGMLGVAATKGVYRTLWQVEGGRLDVEPGTYPVIVACGVVTVGAAPPETLDLLASKVAPGDVLAFTYSDQALADEAYTSRVDALLAEGFDQLLAEHGPNLDELGLGATVYVLRRRN